ncbi:hypothetical protein DL96DRAFT_1600437, partial [Flagelloscypha sp. PMI_526]
MLLLHLLSCPVFALCHPHPSTTPPAISGVLPFFQFIQHFPTRKMRLSLMCRGENPGSGTYRLSFSDLPSLPTARL